MPRAPRLVLEGVPHHIVLRGNNRRRLFSYRRDYQHFIGLMRRFLVEADIKVHALCLMPNHAHFLATPFDKDGLALFIKRTAQRHAQLRNRRYKTTGKLFEQRYFSKPIRSESHLAIATAYIDLNPVRAHIVDDPAHHDWSTFRIHVGMKCRVPGLEDLWTPSDWYRRLASDPPNRSIVYHEWASDCRKRDAWKSVQTDPTPPSGPPPTRPDRTRAAS